MSFFAPFRVTRAIRRQAFLGPGSKTDSAGDLQWVVSGGGRAPWWSFKIATDSKQGSRDSETRKNLAGSVRSVVQVCRLLSAITRAAHNKGTGLRPSLSITGGASPHFGAQEEDPVVGAGAIVAGGAKLLSAALRIEGTCRDEIRVACGVEP